MHKKELLAAWEKNNVAFFFYFGASAAIVGIACLVLFDLLLFGDHYAIYLPHRLTMVVTLACAVLVCHRHKVHVEGSGYTIIFPLSLLIMSMSSIWYLYFLGVCPPEHHQIVLFGNVINIMALSLFTAIFPTINAVFCIFVMASSSISYLYLGSDALLLTISALFAAMLCYAQRHVFATMLYTDYRNKLVIFDAPSAFALTVRRQDQKMEDIFPPRTCAVAILTADLRKSQGLFEANHGDAQTKINRFFNLVNQVVSTLAPDSRKIIKTHGDEINVIIYSHDADDLPALTAQILAIAQHLAVAGFAEARRICGSDLLYDMGVSWGHNLVGLLGPDGLKSPDVYGHVIVDAKRFQDLAKKLRSSEDFPIIVTKNEARVAGGALIASIHKPAVDQRISYGEVAVYRQAA